MSAGTYSAAMFNHQAREILERDHKIVFVFGESVGQSLRRAAPKPNAAPSARTLTFPASAEAKGLFGAVLEGRCRIGVDRRAGVGTEAGDKLRFAHKNDRPEARAGRSSTAHRPEHALSTLSAYAVETTVSFDFSRHSRRWF
jgi:hypothetical protein